MKGLRHKVSLKCTCGKEVAPGSVFCSPCKAEICLANAITMEKEDRNFQKEILGRSKASSRR